jgi:predicted transcriptional regulator
MAKEVVQRIEEARKRLLNLVENNQKLSVKNEVLETEVKRLQQQLKEQELKNEELVNKIKIIKLAQNIGTTDKENADITELKRKINEYIKEIDHCITMLND